MRIEIRTDDHIKKLLFEWDPDNNTIEIVRKREKIRVKLKRDEKSFSYEIVGQEKN